MRSDSTIRTTDGTRLGITSYSPGKSNAKVIIVAPGIGLTHDYYHLFACFLRQHGYTVITFDYRGVGNSAPKKLSGYEATMYQWAVQDINAVTLYAKHHFPKYELIYIGHCIGGEIIGLAPASQYINRLVLVSSALSCSRLWPVRDRVKIEGLKILSNGLNKIFGYFPGKLLNIFGNLPKGVIHEWANWCENPNGLFDDFPDNNYRRLNIPIVAFTFSDDWHCPPRAVKELLDRFENSTITWYHMKPKEIGVKKIGHIDFFYVGMRSTLWRSLLQWIEKDDRSNKEITIHKTLST